MSMQRVFRSATPLGLGLAMSMSIGASAAPSLDSSVEAFGSYVLYHWQQDPKLKKHNPPQIITNVKSDTKVLGGCVATHNGRISADVGGTSYCPRSNTIYVVQDQLAPLYKYFGSAAIAYVIAHEYGHYLQSVFGIGYQKIVSELQADCLSGAILGQGAKELNITSRDIINMAQAAYSIGSDSHGTGAQRAYAVYAGFGQSAEMTCSTADIRKLALGQIKDPIYGQMASRRSLNGVDLDRPQTYLRSISGSLLPAK
ncbi:MAG: hypothetical protein RLZZ459_1565 [Cyanobacteriota bacterium]|jgi:hypothetical protein